LTDFQELPEHQLRSRSDGQLIAYLRSARQAGRLDAMKPAIGLLVYGYWDSLVNRARLKLSYADAEDVAAEAAASAIASAFDGRSVGEFRSWLHTILARRIADYHEARRRRAGSTALPSEHQGDEEVWGRDPATPFEGEALPALECLARAYEELEHDRHKLVIDRYVFGPQSAGEVADLVDGMSEANVHQIGSRFQRRVRELLREGAD
jgi:RNA polymerase sigma factor (sigma-70 family)